ncbi:hypothetical protein [Arthrobacter flavus]|uniref:Uncharacterized protein n=1 Tax=Arthrobacter flavus TaxID=95172 RepID=A0ABW4Q7T3_9MICC
MEEEAEIQGHRLYTGATIEEQAAVGRIASWAASVEQNLAELCVSLINQQDHEVGYAVIANMSAGSMIQLAKKLVNDSDAVPEQERADFLALLIAAQAGLKERNKILHASTGELRIGDKPHFFHRRKRGSVASGPQPYWEATEYGQDELDEIGARLFKVSDDLWAYVNLPAD